MSHPSGGVPWSIDAAQANIWEEQVRLSGRTSPPQEPRLTAHISAPLGLASLNDLAPRRVRSAPVASPYDRNRRAAAGLGVSMLRSFTDLCVSQRHPARPLNPRTVSVGEHSPIDATGPSLQQQLSQPRFQRQPSRPTHSANVSINRQQLEHRNECITMDVTYLSSMFAGFFKVSNTSPRIYSVLILADSEHVDRSPGVYLMFRFREHYPRTLPDVTPEEARSLEVQVGSYRSYYTPAQVHELQVAIDDLVLNGSDDDDPADRDQGFVWQICDFVIERLAEFVSGEATSGGEVDAGTLSDATGGGGGSGGGGGGSKMEEMFSVITPFDVHCDLEAVIEKTMRRGRVTSHMKAIQLLIENRWDWRKAAKGGQTEQGDRSIDVSLHNNMDVENTEDLVVDDAVDWEAERECEVCCEDLPESDGIQNLTCGHWICLADFEQYANHAVESSTGALVLNCFADGCDAPMDLTALFWALTPVSMQRYHQG